MSLEIRERPYHHETDFNRVRDFLIATYPLTPVGFNWEIRRWEGWCLHREQFKQPPWDKVHLWETENRQLVGVAHPEGSGDAHLQLHPDFRGIEEEMMAWAEANLAGLEDDKRRLDIFVNEYDVPRQRLLEKRGYEKQDWLGVTWKIRLGERPYPSPPSPPGYHIRSTTPNDYQRVADALNAGFERDSHTADELRYFMTHAPSFRHDLDLAAEASDGSFAAYVGVIYDAINKRGIFEPVCTAPEHRRRGLARALMFEGLHRLKALGAESAYLGTGDMVPANRLYEAFGFTEAYKGYVWRKLF
jgi:mycothiol synthase